jgi:DNA-binding IclR family transcriptional regulator
LRAWNETHPKAGAMTIASVAALRDEVRAHGVARARGEDNERLSAMSAPVFDVSGRLVMCISLFGIAGTFSTEWNGPIATILKGAGIALSRQLGARTSDETIAR